MPLLAFLLGLLVAVAPAHLRAVLPADNPPAGWVESVPLSGEILTRLWATPDLSPFLRCWVDDPEGELPAMLGEVSLTDDRLRFQPRFPLRAGLRYRATLDLVAVAGARATIHFEVPAAATTSATEVVQILPDLAAVPANLLRVYVEFSSPMRETATPAVEMLDGAGRVIPDAFVDTPPLWDASGRRLTLICHPGRIKRGLAMSDRLGTALVHGQRITVRVLSTSLDATGQAVREPAERSYQVLAADRTSPDPVAWRLAIPHPGGHGALRVDFGEPLDATLLGRMLALEHADGRPVAGQTSVLAGGFGWSLRPDAAWEPGPYRLRVAAQLEDLAANRVDSPFESAPGSVTSTQPRLVPFVVQASGEPVALEPLVSGTASSLRGISAVSDDVAWVSGTDGWIARTLDGGVTWRRCTTSADMDSLDFRDVEAFGPDRAFVMSAGPSSRSRIYRTDDGGQTWELLYTIPGQGFLNAIDFWDAAHGVAVGDPVDGTLTVLRTEDGRTWRQIDAAPRTLPDEFGFAASGTNLVAVDPDQIWIGTGGQVARILFSRDRGETWGETPSPMVSGASSTGIFSLAMSPPHGLAVGGNYQEPQRQDTVNALRREGDRWVAVEGLPYHSCVRFLPGRPDHALAVGRAGIHRTRDAGRSWERLSADGYYTMDLASDGVAWLAGPQGRVARLRLGP